MSSRIWKAAPRKKPKRSIGSRSTSFLAPDQRSHPQRQQRRVPARLLDDHVEVVVGRQVGAALPLPAQLPRLPVDRLPGHEVELRPDLGGQPVPQPVLVVPQRAQREDGEPVAGVHRECPTVPAVERRPTSPQLTVVLDVVVDEEGGVEELDRRGGRQGVLDVTPERRAGREAERRTQALAGPLQVVRGRDADVRRHPAAPQVRQRCPAGDPVVVVELLEEGGAGGRHGVPPPSSSHREAQGDRTVGRPGAGEEPAVAARAAGPPARSPAR